MLAVVVGMLVVGALGQSGQSDSYYSGTDTAVMVAMMEDPQCSNWLFDQDVDIVPLSKCRSCSSSTSVCTITMDLDYEDPDNIDSSFKCMAVPSYCKKFLSAKQPAVPSSGGSSKPRCRRSLYKRCAKRFLPRMSRMKKRNRKYSKGDGCLTRMGKKRKFRRLIFRFQPLRKPRGPKDPVAGICRPSYFYGCSKGDRPISPITAAKVGNVFLKKTLCQRYCCRKARNRPGRRV